MDGIMTPIIRSIMGNIMELININGCVRTGIRAEGSAGGALGG